MKWQPVMQRSLPCLLWARTIRRKGLQSLLVLALGPVSVLLPGCRTEPSQTPAAATTTQIDARRTDAEPSTVAARPSVHHWIQNDELYDVMKQLGVTTAANWPTDLPDDPEVPTTPEMRAQAFRDGMRLADALSQSAREIPRTVAGMRMSEADRMSFTSNAHVLSDQARLLGQAARKHNVEGMQRQLEAIRSSCISCHTRFKDISGELPPRT